MPNTTSKTFTAAELQTAANVFIQKNGRNQESDWRWERTEMLNQFIAGLFAKTASSGIAMPEVLPPTTPR
jgi:hypothetical protein